MGFAIRLILGLWILLLWPGPALAAGSFTATVTGIIDGDSIMARHQDTGQTIEVRLYGIDCPEWKQPWGDQARAKTAELCYGKEIQVVSKGRDRYKRLVAEIVVLETQCIVNYELLRTGLAWWYRKYAPMERDYQRAEGAARAMRRGLWSGPEPVPPWIWRRAPKTAY